MLNNDGPDPFPEEHAIAHTILGENAQHGQTVTLSGFHLTYANTGCWAIRDKDTDDPITFLNPRAIPTTINLLDDLDHLREIVDNGGTIRDPGRPTDHDGVMFR